ncbi:MAG: right-handed parallel beta-helix repeat-containing protein [Synergistaceae bacterium]|nr:right-handed parallel beta-helix repeat-containing protein [Synergistaceae bacterium]
MKNRKVRSCFFIYFVCLFVVSCASLTKSAWAVEVSSWRELEEALRDMGEGALSDCVIDVVEDIVGPRTISHPSLPAITRPVTIRGNGYAIDAGTAGLGSRRVFYVAEKGDAAFIDLTIQGGNSVEPGGGVYVEGGRARFVNCTISGNRSFGYGGGIAAVNAEVVFEKCRIGNNNAFRQGGGIFQKNGRSRFWRCAISGNALFGSGGGVFVADGDAEFIGCEIFGNKTFSDDNGYGGVSKTDGHGAGGGLMVGAAAGVTVSFTDCAIYDNDAGHAGGGVTVKGGGSVNFTNCTITGNKAALEGGGVSIYGGNASFTGCTVTKNRGRFVGGLHVSGTVRLRGSIVAGNALDDQWTKRGGLYSGEAEAGDLLVDSRHAGTLTGDGYNLIGAAAGEKVTWKRTDTLDRSLSYEAIFGKNELTDNGAPVKTLKVLPEGRAFAKIPSYVQWLPRYNKRKRERLLFRVNIGALGPEDFSSETLPAKAVDAVPRDVKTWRQLAEAIEVVNGGLFFGVSDDVVTLTEDICYDGDKRYPSLPVIETSLRIVGNGHRIDAGVSSADNRPVFDIEGDRVRFEDLTITGGYADFGGGVHIMKGEADFVRCRIAANLARFGGGGVYVREDGTAGFQDCEIMNNGVRGQGSDKNGGGGIGSGGKRLVLENSRVADNWADGNVFGGGGIFVQKGVASLDACAVSGNRSSGSGGGLHARGARFVIENTQISENRGREAGALFVLDEGAELRNCRLSHNRTEHNGNGGAVFFSSISSASSNSSRDGALQMMDTVVSENVSGANGGGICVEFGRAFFIRCEISSNDARGADAIGGGVITGNHGFFEGTTVKSNRARGEPDDLWITSRYGEGIVNGGGNVMGQVHGRFPGLEKLGKPGKNVETNKIVAPGQTARKRAFEVVNLLRTFKAAAMALWSDVPGTPNPGEKFTVPGVLEHLGPLPPSEAAKLCVKIAENQWWVGCDVSSENAETRAVLKSLEVCDEDGKVYSGGPVAYMLAVTLRP